MGLDKYKVLLKAGPHLFNNMEVGRPKSLLLHILNTILSIMFTINFLFFLKVQTWHICRVSNQHIRYKIRMKNNNSDFFLKINNFKLLILN